MLGEHSQPPPKLFLSRKTGNWFIFYKVAKVKPQRICNAQFVVDSDSSVEEISVGNNANSTANIEIEDKLADTEPDVGEGPKEKHNQDSLQFLYEPISSDSGDDLHVKDNNKQGL